MPTRIKICGITSREDARVAVNLGVEALGFNFVKKSPRFIEPADARDIIRRLPPFVSRVGVFVDERSERALDIAAFTGIDTFQFHGQESPEYCAGFPCAVIKAFGVGPQFDASVLATYRVSGYLLDTWDKNLAGGSGRTFDWSVAERACAANDNIILAGGLNSANLEEALSAVRPYGVDLNSGVEIRPGVKNPHKMREAVRIIRAWESGAQ